MIITSKASDLPAKVEEVLKEIEITQKKWVILDKPMEHTYGRLPDEKEIRAWSVPRTTGVFLNSFCRSEKPKTVVEVGTSMAYSTLWIASACPSSQVFTIENLPEKQAIAAQNICNSGLGNIHLIKKEALEVFNKWDIPIDFLFLDADPANYIKYYKLVKHLFREGSWILMDNALNHKEVTSKFIEFMRHEKQWETWMNPLDNGLLMSRYQNDS